jgi:hypothetical protein
MVTLAPCSFVSPAMSSPMSMPIERVMLRFFVWLSVLSVHSVAFPQAPDPPLRTHQKKLIQWGWDEPDPAFMRAHIDDMERLPFDGVVFHVNSSQGGNFVWEMWGSQRFERDEFDASVADLKATNFRRLTERFLRVNVTPGDVDWFDDEAWSVVRHNAGVAAQVAHDGGCRGFMFDVEQYQHELFNFEKLPGRSWEECRARVRRRGQEWMQEVNNAYPDITILLTFGYKLAQPPEGMPRSAARYGLLADFLDGMLAACIAETVLVDGWEQSYSYKHPAQFGEARETILTAALAWTAEPEKYKTNLRAGFGIWLDYDWRHKGWDTEDLGRNYFSPAQFAESVQGALEASDGYVWIYSEQPRWWTGEKLPAAYVEALRSARRSE